MALSKEQAEALAELERLRDEPEENPVQLHVKDENGRTTILEGQYATKWLRNLGLVDDDVQEEGGDGDDPEGGAAEGDTGKKAPEKKPPKWFGGTH